MSDLALQWIRSLGAADLVVEANDILQDDTLETSVLLSLFTNLGAWWGDPTFGSKLYLLARERDTPSVLERAAAYAREALAWMVEDRVAAAVDATAESLPLTPGTSILALTVTIQRPSGSTSFTYNYNWQAQELAHGV